MSIPALYGTSMYGREIGSQCEQSSRFGVPRAGYGVIYVLRVEVKMRLMYDLLYTKTREGDEDHQNWIEIAITGVLIVGALALEIYAAIVLFSSNWGMLWLIKHGKKEWVIWLSQRFPRLFNKKKNWSKMMGQFDLLGYLHKSRERDVQSSSSKIIGKMLGGKYEDKWNRYVHKTECSVHPLVYKAILELLHKPLRISDSLTCELDEIWAIPNEPDTDFLWLVMHVYLATQICYLLETEWDAAGGEDDPSGSNSSSWEENMKVSKALSDYMMYLLIMHPSLLPNVGSRLRDLERLLFDRHYLTGEESDVNVTCRYLLRKEREGFGRIAKLLKEKQRSKRWELIKRIWLRTLHTATSGRTSFGQKNSHFQQLRKGGELLTLIWFINPPKSIPFV
ncbi:hypothetical protein RHSIM_Rhsim01G0020700 [Rhododendron simsii]|uniref:DUF4220 domain-containing protein n=1 Tax=Rhododendron simsii TaxID=118357 RepID=A0A834HK75_RHOSS|nr:hypothetical protein RHSIM_Rhsim01G0020700 [Rhododendron simsii]